MMSGKGRALARFWAASLPLTPMLAAGCSGGGAPALPATALPPANDVYRLGLGDKLRVTVFGEQALSGEYQVSGAGSLSMPLIGDVRAVGLSARELEAALVRRFSAGYLRDPKIAVEVYDFRPYFILGEVQRPGRYPSAEGTTILGAVATAGGFTYRANTKRVFLRRGGGREYEVAAGSDVKVQPGDVIRVGERYF